MFEFGSIIVTVIAVFITIPICLYLFLTRHFNFWKKRGVIYVRPLPFFGNLKDVLLQKKYIGYYLKDIYEENINKPYVGIFAFDQPALLVNDLEIVKNILVKDSRNFIDRMVKVDESLSPLNANAIFALRGQKWKHVRTSLTPTFTTGKMKNMFYLVDKCGQQLVLFIEKFAKAENPVAVKDAVERFTMDVTAMCAFGIECNSLQDPKAEFSNLLHRIFQLSFTSAVANLATFFAPWVQNFFRLKLMDSEIEDRIRDIVWRAVHLREKTGEKRNDLLDYLMELRTSETSKLDGDDFVAQAFGFLVAGFHTSSMTLTFALYELSVHQDIQTTARTEIKDVLEHHKKKVTYYSIKDMKYLDMVVNETLRKYPAIPFLDRRCQEDYPLTQDLMLPAGTGVYIPVYALHHDSKYFPSPAKFDPERFSEKNKQNIPHFAYMPFGEGPRNCIGMRFGSMQVKAALIHILSNFEVSPCKETRIPLIIDPKPFNLMALGGVYLNITKFNN
uniref:Cytochrome P450 6j1 n=1 Tax=Blattella germanica TaxID=6973 RepID=CP6J1_BLAGE|nr:RecName: Full=Cytochrome P450 6j1; AltName: Full=CYPVIJ1 [Blattella germanica]AAK57913.1 cytochrome P450 CYP6J1 [Blattella germanica]